jgi:hypothetical protein
MKREIDAQRQHEEVNDSTVDMDVLMEAVAAAISQSEREATAAHAEATGEAPEMSEMREAREAEREADDMRRAKNFLLTMGTFGGEQTREISREDYGRRRGKEPAHGTSHAADEVTPPEHKAHRQTPPTRPYGRPGPSRFRPATHGEDKGAATPAY